MTTTYSQRVHALRAAERQAWARADRAFARVMAGEVRSTAAASRLKSAADRASYDFETDNEVYAYIYLPLNPAELRAAIDDEASRP